MLRLAFVLLALVPGPLLALPPRVDLTNRNTTLKAQGQRGTCFSFATVAAIEAAYVRAGYPRMDLSEEFTVYTNRMFCRLNGAYAGARRAQTLLGDVDRGYTRHLLALFAAGFAVPGEKAMPYRARGYTHPSRPAAFWTEQYNVSSFNLDPRNLPVRALTAVRYYGLHGWDLIPNDQLHNPVAYMQVLARGHEVIIDFHVSGDRSGPVWRYSGPVRQKDDKHSMLIVGYDQRKRHFVVKNSWDRTRFTFITFDYLRYVFGASYVLKPAPPRPWPELGMIGRWQLQSGKVTGVLDVYHLPGLSRLCNAVVYGKPGPDRDYRLGTFYVNGDPRRAFRVNGRVHGRQMELWIDPKSPNLRPDAMTGKRLMLQGVPNDPNALAGKRARARRLTDAVAFAGSDEPYRLGIARRSPLSLEDFEP